MPNERPILFSAPMVRAILEGRKTQTRRVMKSQPYTLRTEGFGYPTKAGGFVSIDSPHCLAECPYGVLGDRLWVRETWIPVTHGSYEPWDRDRKAPRSAYEACIVHRADNTIDSKGLDEYQGKWRPSIFMPRWASRITLEITDVRVQRLQEISEEDAEAEGAEQMLHCGTYRNGEPIPASYRYGFQYLWDSINTKTHPWSSNPWVWAISFGKKDAQ